MLIALGLASPIGVLDHPAGGLRLASASMEPDRAGRVALHYAALDGRIEDVRAAVMAGEELAPGDAAGFTPLHFAAQQGHADVARLLVEAGAPLEARNRFGNTPLWVAAMNSRTGERERVVSLLVAAGASVDATNDAGVRVRDVAKRMGFTLPPR